MKWHNVLFQLVMSLIMIGGCTGAGVVLCVLAWKLRNPVFIAFAPATFTLAGLMSYLAGDANLWVELDGDIVRAKNLYTLRVSERPVREIQDVETLYYALRDEARTVLTEAFQGRVRGFAIRFPNHKRGFRVYRPEMTNIRALIEGLIAKMAEQGEVVSEIVDFEGRPMIKRVASANSFDDAGDSI